MEPFTKKIEFSTEEEDCPKGCYLLISAYSDLQGDKIPINRNYPFSLIVHSHPKDIINNTIPVITVPVDEYVVGTVEPLYPYNQTFQFYSVWLNSDESQVVIDFQSHGAGIFINVGNERPNIVSNVDFPFMPNGGDTIYTISKNDIIAKYSARYHKDITSLKNLVLTIGISGNLTDSVFTTPFAFIVRLANNNKNDIYRINSDHKALCKTHKLSNGDYRCLYIIEFDFLTKYNNLFIYPTAQNKSVIFNIYASYIKADEFEMKRFKPDIENSIPTEKKHDYSNVNLENDYIFINSINKDRSYLMVSVIADGNTIIELLTTFSLFQNSLTPNPSSPQLLIGVKDFPFTLNFPREYSVMANIVGVGGQAEISWSFDPDNKYYLSGRDDRLFLTSNGANNEHKLNIATTHDITNGTGFVFYVEYNIRADNENFDALVFDKSVRYVYFNDLPIIYYTPVHSLNMVDQDYLEIFFSFNDLENEEKKERTFYENIPFSVNGKIIEELMIYEAKIDPSMQIDTPKNFYGFYDPSMRTGIFRVSKNDIDHANNGSSLENPYLYLKIDKKDEFKNIRKYKKISIETNIYQKSAQIPVSELTYQFGILMIDETEKTYTLRTHETLKYMNLEFSCVDDELSIEVNHNAPKFVKKQYGISYYYIELDSKSSKVEFKVKRADPKSSALQFYTFRYTFSNDQNKIDYEIKDTTLNVAQTQYTNGSSSYSIQLTPLSKLNDTKASLTYIIRAMTGLNAPKNPDITLKGNTQNVKEFYNPKANSNNGLLTLEITNLKNKISFIQVIVQIQTKEKVDYLSYDYQSSFSIMQKESDDKGLEKWEIITIIIGVASFIIIFILIVIIIIFNNKNKNLMEKVNKVCHSYSSC